MKKLLLPLFAGLCVNVSHADTVNIITHLTSVNNCRVNHTCDQAAHHEIQIINDTDQNHYYNYSYSVCMGSECEWIGNSLYVNAHTTWNNSHNTVGHFLFDQGQPGGEDVVAETRVGGTETRNVQDIRKVDVR